MTTPPEMPPRTAPIDTVLDGEEAIVQTFLAPLAAGYPGAFGLADDCAAFTPTPGHDLVVKTDPVAAGVHFLDDDAPEDVGWKALAVNVSDLAAKAAVPRAYLMALSFPAPPTRDWMRRFAAGLGEAQAAFGMHLIGGDTDRRPGPVTVSITVIGEVPAGRMVRRGTARPDDRIFVSGTLGAAAIGLAIRLAERRDPAVARELVVGWIGAAAKAAGIATPAIAASLRPTPRLGLRAALAAHASAAMDLSDGLAKDLGRMCKASGCAAEVALARLPLLPIVEAAVRAEPSRWLDVVASGDDYEVLAAVPPGRAAAFLTAAAAGGVPVAEIGKMTHGAGVRLLSADGTALALPRIGWDHF